MLLDSGVLYAYANLVAIGRIRDLRQFLTSFFLRWTLGRKTCKSIFLRLNSGGDGKVMELKAFNREELSEFIS